VNASKGIAFILLAFPIYLLWKGRLPAYLALTKTAAAPSTPSGTSSNVPTTTPALTSLSQSWAPGLTYMGVTQPNGTVQYGYGTAGQN